MDEARVLEVLTQSEALLEGHFELRSGLHSGRFFQCANLLRYPDRAEMLCRALVTEMQASLGEGFAECVIAPALGGIIVGHEVARALRLPSVFAEKQHDILVMRRFTIKPGARYVVAEDVVTRGGRVQETMDLVEAGGGIVAAVGVLVDRSGGKFSVPCPMFSLLRLEPVTYEADACPLCRDGLELVHPGS